MTTTVTTTSTMTAATTSTVDLQYHTRHHHRSRSRHRCFLLLPPPPPHPCPHASQLTQVGELGSSVGAGPGKGLGWGSNTVQLHGDEKKKGAGSIQGTQQAAQALWPLLEEVAR